MFEANEKDNNNNNNFIKVWRMVFIKYIDDIS